ncbi:MAG: multiheme c-type cytochrome [Candidatus Thiodiazotropha sp.]
MIRFKVLMCVAILIYAVGARAESLYLERMASARWSPAELADTLTLLQQHEDIEPVSVQRPAPFHQQKAPQVDAQREFCVACHTTLPHSENKRLRSYLNLHVQSLACTSCHFRPEEVELSYRHWPLKQSVAADDAPSLIAPFSAGVVEAFTREQPEIERLIGDWKQMDIQHKAAVHLHIHLPLDEQGPGCGNCHTREEPMLDLQALEYDEEQIRKIQQDRVARFLGDESLEDQPIRLIDLLR